jgi:cation diffusion facilitator family transporter
LGVDDAVRNTAEREKRLVALGSVVAAVLLTGMKLVVGWVTNSLGILSEAAHSGLDLVAAAVTYWAVSVASRPADREHTYGHGKFENLSALFETLLLLATCVWIIYEVVERLAVKEVVVEVGIGSFVVMGISIVVDLSRSRVLARTAKKYSSQALEADALHFSTDVWSSSVVIVGLVCMVLSDRLGLPWLSKADALAALAVAAVAIWVSVRLGKKSINDLLDAVPSGLREQAERAAHVQGVVEVRQVRVRRSGPETFADVTLTVNHQADLERTHAIATASEEAVRQAVPGADVVVHVEPDETREEGASATVRRMAARLGLSIHSLSVSEQPQGLVIELHVELDPSEPLGLAHDRVTAFEQSVRATVPGVLEVVTHIEPANGAAPSRPAPPETRSQVQAVVERACSDTAAGLFPHSVDLQSDGHRMDLSFHCVMHESTSVLEAHDVAEQVEASLRVRLPHLRRVLIHMEPADRDSHVGLKSD